MHHRMAAKCKNQGPHDPADVSGLHCPAVGWAWKVLDKPVLQKLSLHRVRGDVMSLVLNFPPFHRNFHPLAHAFKHPAGARVDDIPT